MTATLNAHFAAITLAAALQTPAIDNDLATQKTEAMILGTLVGDAAGGPVEFVDPARWPAADIPFKHWRRGETLPAPGSAELDAYGDALALLPYTIFRPNPEPYAHWLEDAPPGTLTDDTRQKIILINAIADAGPFLWNDGLTEEDLADAYIDAAKDWDRDYEELAEESLREYLFAANWINGDRDPETALPPSRLWAALPTCAGQMAMLPLAALAPGDPEAAYRLTYDAAFIDVGRARDINAALVAGLAHALAEPVPAPDDRAEAWARVKAAMRNTDPYRYADVPWTTRPIHDVIDAAERIAAAANRNPRRLITAIEALEPPTRPRTWWEADITAIMAIAAIEATDAHPIASIRLAIELGYDTDSTAQLAGAFMGAIHGPGAFPDQLTQPVREALERDYDQSIEDWLQTLTDTRDRKPR